VVDSLSVENIDDLVSIDEWLDILGVRQSGRNPGTTKERLPPDIQTGLADAASLLQQVDPLDFERLMKELFQRLNFQSVRLTKRSHDGGVDLVMARHTVGGVEHAVAQCKRTRLVGVSVARELLGVLASDASITKGYILASGSVSSECRALCERDGRLACLAGPEIARYLNEFGIGVAVSKCPRGAASPLSH